MGDILGSQNPNWRGGNSSHPLYLIYHDIKSRCTNPSHQKYSDYGGRGIRICEEWRKDFWSFVRDVGPRPDDSKTAGGRAYWQLDRIDNEGHYEPGNVRWASPSEQVRNRRRSAYAGVLRGSKQATSRLREEDVLDIVARIPQMGRGGQRRLAEQYGVSYSLVNNIWRGKVWAWLTGR